MRNVIEVLQERGFIDAMTSDELKEKVNQPMKVYCGFDPTSDSLHVGNMVAIMGLAWFQRCGHTPVVILGGATGMIGDPSGKTSERQLLSEDIIRNNVVSIKQNFSNILKLEGSNKAIFLNNFDWFKDFSFISFLRDVGKLFRIGPMLAKDSVKARMNSEEGMSFTEFCYQVLQGYDYLHLYNNQQVTLQLGGSDQWGNITAGIELIRKVKGESAFGLTFPLLTRSDGQKFGKSEKGAIWLSPDKLSPYDFYQYFYRVADADVIQLMRLLTFMDMSEIRQIDESMKSPNYLPNSAQKRLAEEVTRIVHTEEGLQYALKVTQTAAPGMQTSLDASSLQALSGNIPTHTLETAQFQDAKVIDILVAIGAQPSKGEARKLIANGGLYINNESVNDVNRTLTSDDLIGDTYILLGLGKKNKILLQKKN